MSMHIRPVINGSPRITNGFNHRFPNNRVESLTCEPPTPLTIDQPGNPMSWISGITRLNSASQSWMACIQSGLTSGILGDSSIDPVMLRHSMFMAAVLIGKMYDLEKYAIGIQEQNKKANEDTFGLALAAR